MMSFSVPSVLIFLFIESETNLTPFNFNEETNHVNQLMIFKKRAHKRDLGSFLTRNESRKAQIGVVLFSLLLPQAHPAVADDPAL